MTPKVRFVILLCAVGLLLVAGNVLAQEMPARADLAEGWNWIEPGGGAICSLGTPYSFAVREGSSENLLIYLEGGGACWNDQTCFVGSQTFDPSVDPATDDPAAAAGIFALDNAENPFADYDMVFIPYCTADVHMGDNVVTYGKGDKAVEIHHKGFVNASAALEWTYANFDAPERVFLTGGSAGALGSIFHAPFVMQHYEDVPVVQLGDAAGGYRSTDGTLAPNFTTWGTVDILPDWVDGFEGVTPETLSFEQLYIATAQEYPDNTFAQYNAAMDEVQVFFLSLVKGAGTLDETLPADLADIEAGASNFRYYTAGGTVHTVLTRPEFYDYRVGDVRLRDWVADLAAGESVENVTCDADSGECAKAPGGD